MKHHSSFPAHWRGLRTTLLLGSLSVALLLAGCAARRPLYVYRAYQEPSSARGPYYLREVFVAAPDHARAADIVANSLGGMRPDWSGPIYLSYVGVTDTRRQAGMLGGPVWLETAGDSTGQMSIETAASTEAQMRESLSIGAAADSESSGWLPRIAPRHPQ